MTTRWMPAAFALAGLIALTGLTGSAKAGLTVNGETDPVYQFIDPKGPTLKGSKGPHNDPKAADILAYLKVNENYSWVTESNYQEVIGESVWKWNQDGKDGTDRDGYSFQPTVYSDVDGEPDSSKDGVNGGVLSFAGDFNTLAKDFSTLWLVIKDGSEGFVVYDLAGIGGDMVDTDEWNSYYGNQNRDKILVNWNGSHDLVITNPFPGGSDISNIQIYGGSFKPSTSETPLPAIPEPATSIVWLISACLCGLFIHRRVRRLRVA